MKLSWPMSMKTRIARHGQAAIRASLSSTPREPLLFLYPTFARKSSTAPSPIEISTPNRPPPTTSSSTHSTADASHTVSADTSAYPLSQAALDGTALPPPRVDGKISGQVNTSTPRSRHKGRVKNVQVEEVVRTPMERRMRRILSQAQRAKEEEQRKFALQREWQSERNEELLRPGDPDWRVILQKLKESTPQHGKWLAKAITITGPTKSLERLLLGLDEDIWSVANAYDCTVGLGPRKDSSDKYQPFVLSGSAVSISKTAAHLLRIAPGIQINSHAPRGQPEDGIQSHMDSNVSKDGQDLPGHLRYVIPVNLRDPMQLGEDGLPCPPTKWNQSSFYKYVFDLTRIKVYKPSNSSNHGKNRTSAVRDILHDLFTSPEYKHWIASKAIKEAVNFFLNISCIHEVRAIFNTHSIKDPQLYNLMLGRAAKFSDLQNYQFILNLMIRKGFLPNRGTWLAFLNANKHNLQIRLTILSAMKEKGLVQNTLALKEACQVLSIADLEISLSKLESQGDYMDQMDLKFGPNWLSSNSAHRILQVLASNGFISRACEFLEIMESRFIKVGTTAVNTILQHCNTSRNLAGGLEVVKFVTRFKTFTPDEETYRILFRMAWESKNYNLSRIVWKYACLSGLLAYRTKDRIGRRIWRSRPTTSEISSRTRFLSLVADFLVGIQISVPSDEDPVEATRVKKEFWATFLEQETNLWQDWVAARPFEVMLQEAFELDMEWKARQAKSGEHFELQWMMVNGLNVPTRPYKSVVRNVVVSTPENEVIRKYAV